MSKVKLTIVIPVHGDRGVLQTCLAAACASDYHRFDVLVVGDRITDEAMSIVSQFPVTFIPNNGVGVSAARNTGARQAAGEAVLFIDSDIELPPDALGKIAESLSQADLAGVVGLISEDIPYPDFFSRFKNLWMHYTYRVLPETVSLFYTSCAAIRRDVFLSLGGFDEHYQRPSVEDTDFGRKLGEAGVKVTCRKDLCVVHWKRYTFWEVLSVDFLRSSALVKHILRQPARRQPARVGETSVPRSYIASLPLALLAGFGGLAFLATGLLPVAAAAALFGAGTVWLNRGWLGYLHRRFGWRFLVKSVVFIHLELWFVAAGVLHGLGSYLTGERY